MSTPAIVLLGTAKELEASGAAIGNNSIGSADDANWDRSSDGGNYPFVDVEMDAIDFDANTPTENSSIDIYTRNLDLYGGTNDEEAPEASGIKPHFLCSIPVNNVTTAQSASVERVRAPKKCTVYVHVNGCGYQLQSGWKLRFVPRAEGTA